MSNQGLERPVQAGIDEAGRGPVLGPLVVAGVAVPDPAILDEMGCRDSKRLSPTKREAIDRMLRSHPDVRIEVRAIAPEVLNAEMQDRKLNDIVVDRFREIALALHPHVLCVDAADSDADRFKRAVAVGLPRDIEVVSEHKADDKHPVVGAASIVAKVARDAAYAELVRRLEPRLQMQLGSDYGDPRTDRFLRAWFAKFGDLPEGTRRSWASVRDLRTEEKNASVERDALNFFEPFERLPPNHENQLTRALLLVLRLSPVAHESWLTRAAPGRRLHELPVAVLNTQRRAVRADGNADDQVPLVSIFLAPNKPLGEDAIVKESDRQQVLDGVIEYGDALVMVIENKVAEASDSQARELNITGAGVVIAPDQERQVVTWPEVIGDITGIVERGLAGGAERAILEDFLAYVEDHFAELGPYRTLGLCAGNEFRTRRRLRALLGEAADREARIDKWGPRVELPELPGTASRACLFSANGGIELSVYPGDTLSQARAFYTRPAAVAGILSLAQDPEWKVQANFHFGHMEGGYAWTTTTANVERYIQLWQERIGETKVVKREEWDAYWAWLLQEDLALPNERAEFDRHFTATNRQSATPRPGLKIVRRWELNEAEALDGQHLLGAEIATALQTVTAALAAP